MNSLTRKVSLVVAATAAFTTSVLAVGSCAGTSGAKAVNSQPALTPQEALTEALGVNKVVSTPTYLLVFNIVGPEQMYTSEQLKLSKPNSGEWSIKGNMTPIKADSRHFEVHVYDKATGKTFSDVKTKISFTDVTDGRTPTDVEATLMQDLVVGEKDLHYGNNVEIIATHDFRVDVVINGETGSMTGRLL